MELATVTPQCSMASSHVLGATTKWEGDADDQEMWQEEVGWRHHVWAMGVRLGAESGREGDREKEEEEEDCGC